VRWFTGVPNQTFPEGRRAVKTRKANTPFMRRRDLLSAAKLSLSRPLKLSATSQKTEYGHTARIPAVATKREQYCGNLRCKMGIRLKKAAKNMALAAKSGQLAMPSIGRVRNG
jgi:hypothetical protein